MMADDRNDQLAQEVETLRKKAAEQALRLEEVRAEYEQVCEALRQRGIVIEPDPSKRSGPHAPKS